MISRSLILCATLCLSGCAANPGVDETRSASDPWESFNRPMFAVNDAFDKVLLRPIAKGYEAVFPGFVRQGVSNFSRNLGTPLVLVNNLLQGKGKAAANDAGRLLINSVIGLGGLVDVAAMEGMDPNDEDFGQTFGAWGAPSGPYLVMPFFGPTTLRDALATPFNIAANPLAYYDNTSARDKVNALMIVNARQRLFAAEALIKDSPDRYVTLRESVLQRREYLVYDGNPPVDDDFYDDLEEDFE